MTSDAVLKIIERAAAEDWQKLDLSGRELAQLPWEICELKNLIYLDLSYNKISKITYNTIISLENIKYIDLRFNEIQEIPDSISELKNLNYLRLIYNKIQEIPDSISELKNLTYLDLNSNQIAKIPEAIYELEKLTYLDLGNNKIREISKAIFKLYNLEILSLYNNKIQRIPKTICELKHLIKLDLNNNEINEIPNVISELKELKIFNLQNNKINKIPEVIIQLEKLTTLNLIGNPIENCPLEFFESGIYDIRAYFLNQKIINNEYLKIEHSIEFPPEYWTAGNSILSYFSHILNVKYPKQNIKVKIEQEGLVLRMTIDTLEGTTETIEQTFNDYIMVISRQLPPESLLSDPYEVMALKNKLQIAEMELRITRENFAAFRDDSRQRIDSLEMQISQLFSIIGQSLQKDHHITVNLNQELSNQQRTGDDVSGDKVGQDKIGRDKIAGE